MSIEVILQILVFPVLGSIWLRIVRIETDLAAHRAAYEERLIAAERRLEQLETAR